MKRTISLILCLTILLGLLTGLAGATETEGKTPALSASTQMENVSGLNGSEDFNIYLGEIEITSENAKVYFTNPKLGRLIAMSDMPDDYQDGNVNNWVWERNSSYPNEDGELVVLYDGEQYSLPVSTADAWIGLYTEEGCYDESFMPRGEVHIPYPNNGTKTFYVKLDDSDDTEFSATAYFTTGEELNGEAGHLVVGDVNNNTVPITIQNISGEHMLVVQIYDQDEKQIMDWYVNLYGEDSDVIDVVWGTENDSSIPRTNLTQFNGGWGLDILYTDPSNPNAEPIILTSDMEGVEVWFNNGGLGEIRPCTWDENCAWDYNLWLLRPNQTGSFWVSYQGNEYCLFFSTDYPDLGLYTSAECDADSYLVKDPVPTVECNPGEPVTIYAFTTGYIREAPTIGVNSADHSLIEIQELQEEKKHAITFTAPEDASGEFHYEFIWDGVGMEVNFSTPDTSTLRAVGDEGGRLNLLSQRLPGQMSFLLQYKDENGEWKYLDGNQAKVYFAGTNPGGELEPTDFLGTIFFNGTYWIWDTQTAYQNSRAFLCAELPGSETVYMTEVSTRSASFGLYDENDRYMPSSNIGYIVSYASGVAKELKLRFDENFFNNNVDVEQLEMSGTSTTPQIKVTPDKTNGTISVSYDGTPMSGMQVVVLRGSFNQGGFELIIRFVDSVTMPELNTTIPEEVGYVLGEWGTPNASLAHYRHQELTINGEIYYLSPGSLSIPHCDQVGPAHTGTSMWESGKQWFQYAPIIYQKINGSDVPIADPSELGVSDLQLQIYAMPNDTEYDLNGARVSQKMPKVYDGPAWYPGSQSYEFDVDSQGAYLVVASAMVGGEKYYSYATCYLISRQSEVVAVETIEEANAVMRNHPIMGMRDHLVLSFVGETELEGTIYVPDGMSVTLTSGTWDRITLHGGIESDGMAAVSNFNFVGAGNDEELTTWPKNNEYDIPAGTPNYALYGKGPAGASNCSFTGYYTAMRVEDDAHMLNFGGEFNVFQDNYIAIYVDYHGQDGGLGLREGLRFIGNDTAIYIDYLSESLNMNFLQLTNAWFINNGVDIRNDSGRLYWLPMCYFLHTNDKVDLSNPGHHSDKQSNHWQPVTEPEAKNKHHAPAVIASPAAVDPFFKDLSYYYPKHIYVYPAMRALYPIVELEDEMAVTALDETENVIATVTLDEAGVQTQGLSLMADGPVNLDGPANLDGPTEEPAVPEAAFDSTMTRVEEDGKVTLSIAAIPEGYTATVEIPCDGWTTAKVLLDGKEVEHVSVADGVVTFEAAASDAATYTIIRDNYVSELKIDGEEAETIPEGEFHLSGTVKVEAVNGNATVMVAGYTEEGKMVLSEIPVLQDGSFDLTVNNTGNLHNLKVFLLNSMENLLPINGVQKVGKP